MRVTSKGQVTIPVEIRRRLAIDETTEVEFEVSGDVIQIRKAETTNRGKRVLGRLRRAAWDGPSTEELMRLTRGDD